MYVIWDKANENSWNILLSPMSLEVRILGEYQERYRYNIKEVK
jgi:hypothetical protein